MDKIKDADYMDGRRVCKYREIKRLYKIDQLDLPKFLSAPGLACKISKIRIINWHWYATNGWKRH